MDSAVVLALAVSKLGSDNVAAITIDYGQRHRVELMSAACVARFYGVEHQVVDLSGLKQVMKGSSQTDPSVIVPHGHYANEMMKATVVPNRNMILIATAAAFAISKSWDSILYGAHAGDHAIYPDCRSVFVGSMAQALAHCHYYPVTLTAPYVNFSKAGIVTEGAALGVPFKMTYSCYEGDHHVHCGKCGTCVERKEAFIEAGVIDPTKYKE